MAHEIYSELNVVKDDEQKIENMIPEIIGSYSINCDQNLFIMHLDKCKQFTWRFNIIRNSPESIEISKAFLLDDDLPEFSFNAVYINYVKETVPAHTQFWSNDLEKKISNFQLEVAFYSDFYGNFEQKLIIIFENGQRVGRKIGVQVCLESELMKTLQYNPGKHVENEIAWIKRHKIVPFDGEPEICFEALKYPLPPNIEDLVCYGAFDHLDMKLTKENYRERLHLLLHVEEYQRRKEIQNLSITVDDITKYIHDPVPGIHQNFILKLPCDEIVTEQAYQLIGKSGKALVKITNELLQDCLVFEVLLEQILSSEIVLEMSTKLEKYLDQCEGKTRADICFRFVDVFHFMHCAVDNVDLEDVFPQHSIQGDSTWSTLKHPDLSKDQSLAMNEMLRSCAGPPVLILGPFGSGKTRTMATAILELLKQMKSNEELDYKVLICTHSNSAADHYIEDFIHPFLKAYKQSTEYMLIRVNWELRYTAAVSRTVLNYCQVKDGRFVQPTRDEIQKYNIVVSTLVTADVLSRMQLPRDHFSHIFIDEAAQAMEVESIIPICLKGQKTKVILAGDHLQLGPQLSSKTAKRLGLGISLLERLFQVYPEDSPYKLKLLENFRSYKEIVEISSVLFYEGALLPNKVRPPEVTYPLRFYGIHGKEKVSKYHPSFYNTAEVNEILCIIKNIRKNWPDALGKFQPAMLCVLSCFAAQIQEIRLLLRKNGLSSVRVENVNNVQGLEFDVVILSTVRSYMTLSLRADSEQAELGFLSNPKLLNTAITRAKYLCIFIGEPVALCSFGASKPCWKTVLAACHKHGEFHYRLSFDKVMEISNVLRERLDHDIDTADRNKSINAVLEEEQKAGSSNLNHYLSAVSSSDSRSVESSQGTLDRSSLLQKGVPFSASVEMEKSTTDDHLKPTLPNCPVAVVQPHHNTEAPIPVRISHTLRGLPQPQMTTETPHSHHGLAFRFNQNVRNILPTQAHNVLPPTQVQNIHQPFQAPTIILQEHGKGVPPLMPIRAPLLLPNASIVPLIGNNTVSQMPQQAHISIMPVAYMTPDAQNEISKAVVEYETCRVFVNRYVQHTINAFPHISSILQGNFLQLDQFNFESNRFLSTMQLYPFSFIIEKLYVYRKQYLDLLSLYENSLINALPDPTYDISVHTQTLYVQIRDALQDLKVSLEYQYYQRNRVIVTRGNVKECSEASLGLDRSYSMIAFLHSQLVNCIHPVLTHCISWKLTFLCSIKLKLLERIIESGRQEYSNRQQLIAKAASLQFELSELDSSSSTTDSVDQLDSASSIRDTSLSVATNQQSSPGGSSSSVISSRQGFPVERGQKNDHRVLTSSPRSKASVHCVPSPVASTISSDAGNDSSGVRSSFLDNRMTRDQPIDSSIEQSMKATIADLLSLPDSDTTRELDIEVEDITKMIQKLRHDDMDVEEWFFDRQNDPFVKEYIASFERHLACPLPVPDCESTLTSPSTEPWIRKYRMKPKYEPYMDISITKTPFGLPYFDGTFYFERSTSADTVLGVVILENKQIYFPGLSSVNRSLTGDRVRFEILDGYGSQRKGRVVSVLDRGGWSVLCKISLSDHHLMIPLDDKGPPIIVFNTPAVSSDTARSTVGSLVRKFIVKIIGWPLQMMYPVGVIERDVEDNIEQQ